MESDDREPRAVRPRSHLFAVRLWKEDLAGGSEYRGNVREVVSGAFRSVRNWSDLVAFMIERVEEYEESGHRDQCELRTKGTENKGKEAMMIAVMGAAGNVGSKVTDLLLRQNEEVRVFEHERKLDEFRDRGAEVVKGDAANVEDQKLLFKDALAALVLLPENLADPEFVATRS